MSGPLSTTEPAQADKPLVDDHFARKAKTSAKSGEESLEILGEPFLSSQRSSRTSSPSSFSLLSTDETSEFRRANSPLPASMRERASSSPRPSLTSLSKVKRFWLRNKGLALVLLSQFFGVLMNVTTRLLEVEGNNGKGMHPFQILFARMSITFVLASAYMYKTKTEHFPFGLREVRPLLLARGFGGFFGVFGMYYSLLYLPLADATVLTFLAPSLACWACSYLINEPFTRMEQIATYISLLGVVLIARPTSLFRSSSSEAPSASGDSDVALGLKNGTGSNADASNYDHVTPVQRAGAVGMAMLGVLGAAVAYTTIRWIGKRAHPLISVNYFACWCTIVSTVMMFSLPSVGFLLPANLKEWCYLVFLGICGFIMQFLLAAGLQYEKSSRATNMVYCQMLMALAFDKLVFNMTPKPLSIIGSSLILGSALYVAVRKEQVKQKESVETMDRDEERGLVEWMDDEDEDERPLQEVQLRTLR